MTGVFVVVMIVILIVRFDVNISNNSNGLVMKIYWQRSLGLCRV